MLNITDKQHPIESILYLVTDLENYWQKLITNEYTTNINLWAAFWNLAVNIRACHSAFRRASTSDLQSETVTFEDCCQLGWRWHTLHPASETLHAIQRMQRISRGTAKTEISNDMEPEIEVSIKSSHTATVVRLTNQRRCTACFHHVRTIITGMAYFNQT